MVTIVIGDKCDGCGECVDICPSEVFEIENRKAVVVNLDECVECCACVEACPLEVIEHDSC